jgi:hypothetical protein
MRKLASLLKHIIDLNGTYANEDANEPGQLYFLTGRK